MVLMLMLITAVDDRPEIRFLNRHVKEQLCASGAEVWKNLGIELMIHSNELEIIHLNNSDMKSCCSAMFRLWLERQTDASWRQLIEALRQLQLNHLASQIGAKLGLEPSAVNPGNCTSTWDHAYRIAGYLRGVQLSQMSSI